MWRRIFRLFGRPEKAATSGAKSKPDIPEPSARQPHVRRDPFAEPPARGPPRQPSPLDLVIGFDFGTSSTKVAVRTPYFSGGRVVAVGLRQGAKGLARYLLPTRVAVGKEGSFSLEPQADAVLHSDLKIRFMDVGCQRQLGAPLSAAAEESSVLVIGYVALVLRRVSEWFEQERRVAYPGMIPRWQLNVGMPSAGYDDDVMKEAYMQAARAAWWVSGQQAPVTTSLCASAIAKASKSDFDCGLVADALSVVPEVAAEVVGYARSTLRSPGLHVLIDVGASTLDICGFVLHERNGDDCYSLLTADVERLGALMLHRHRLARLRSMEAGGAQAEERLAGTDDREGPGLENGGRMRRSRLTEE